MDKAAETVRGVACVTRATPAMRAAFARHSVVRAKKELLAVKFVVGLFESKGIAEDACNRLRTEGVPAADIGLELLHKTTPVPQAVKAELEGLSVDPFLWGDVQKTYVQYIHNGETAVFVRAETEEDIALAVGTIKQYAPMRIRVVEPSAGATPVGRDVL